MTMKTEPWLLSTASTALVSPLSLHPTVDVIFLYWDCYPTISSFESVQSPALPPFPAVGAWEGVRKARGMEASISFHLWSRRWLVKMPTKHPRPHCKLGGGAVHLGSDPNAGPGEER